MKPPAVPAPVWVQTVLRAGRRCECTGECGVRHDAADEPPAGEDLAGRCPAGPHGPVVRLVAAPRPSTYSLADVWRLPADELAAWCQPCLAGAFAAADRRVDDAGTTR